MRYFQESNISTNINVTSYLIWSSVILKSSILGSNSDICPDLFESKFINSLQTLFTKINLYLAFGIPIMQLVGLIGCLWSIVVIFWSKNISFKRTKYFYVTIFSADIMAIIFLTSLDKTIYFLENFDFQFVNYEINNRFDIMCKLTKYKFFIS